MHQQIIYKEVSLITPNRFEGLSSNQLNAVEKDDLIRLALAVMKSRVKRG